MPFTKNPAENLTPGQILLDAPIPELLYSLGLAIAEAQTKLDENSIKTVAILASNQVPFNDDKGNVVNKSLLQLGFTPVFYHFTESTVELNLTVTIKAEEYFAGDLVISKDGPGVAGKKAEGKITIVNNDDLAETDWVEIKGVKVPLKKGSDAATTAATLKDDINAQAALKDLITASSTGDTVTITAKKEGPEGNYPVSTSKPAAVTVPETLSGGKAAVSGGTGTGTNQPPGGLISRVVNQLIPYGATINVNYHRKYNFDTSGYSKITSKLVSLPGPTEFLDEIKKYYAAKE